MFTTAGGRSRRSTHICLFLNRWPILLIIMFLQLASCHKSTHPPKYCPPSSCGNIQNISYPFRLDSDPPNCGFSSFGGDKNFTLYCHNNSSLFLYLNNNSGRLLVRGINYDNFTIHLVDPGVQQRNCSSLPISPISLSNHSYYTTDNYRPAVLISCDRKQVNNSTSRINKYDDYYYSVLVEITASCKSKISKSKEYSFVIVGGLYVVLKQVMESCSIDMMTLVPFTNDMKKNVPSYQKIHRQFSDGFHLSWFRVFCEPTCYDSC